MKPIVWASVEDFDGWRCVDILKFSDIQWGWVECRRDPEDGHGWRRLFDDPAPKFASQLDALNDAKANVGWLGAMT